MTTMLNDKLPLTPAEWELWGNPIKSKEYYEYILSYAPYNNLEKKDSLEHLQHLIKESVRLRLRSDVPLGVNLSGGIDSASLAATMESLLPSGQVLNAFTASYTKLNMMNFNMLVML